VFAFGDGGSAPAGDRLPGMKLKAPIVGVARVGANGLELAAADGAVFPLGGAPAYGIPQADPGSKMAAECPDWLTDPQTQIRWGEDYIQSRYGTPCQAWAYWQARKYYGPLLAVVLGAD